MDRTLRAHQVLVQPENIKGLLRNRKESKSRIRDHILELGLR